MKKYLITTLISLFVNNIYAQLIPISTDNDCSYDEAGAYYQDANSYFNPYEGTWVYQNGNEQLIVKLRKATEINSLTNVTRDLIIGEYKYVNAAGTTLLNTLGEYDVNYNLQSKHTISGSCVFDFNDNFSSGFQDCVTSINGLKLSHGYEDTVTGKVGHGPFFVAIKSQGVNTQMKLMIYTDTRKLVLVNDPELGETYELVSTNNSNIIPGGFYVLTKQ